MSLDDPTAVTFDWPARMIAIFSRSRAIISGVV
jgi:hypothetical protein